jgi:hypothetical protein
MRGRGDARIDGPHTAKPSGAADGGAGPDFGRIGDRTVKLKSVEKTLRKYASLDEMKAEEYRYWQSRPVHERVRAVSELTQQQYEMKGEMRGVPRLQRTLVRLQFPAR